MACASAAAAPFANGSFELPGSSNAASRITMTNSREDPTGWLSTGGHQAYQAGHTDDIPSYDGMYYVSFGHNNLSGGNLSQTFDTEPGATYEVTYRIAQQQGRANQAAGAFVFDQADISEAGRLGGQVNYMTSEDPYDWRAGQAVRFVARSRSSTLLFSDLTQGDAGRYANWALDDVKVTLVSGGTPTTPPPNPPTTPAAFSATATGADFLQTLVGKIRFASADVGKRYRLYVLVSLGNGLILGKSGTGNQWVLISQNFEDVPFTEEVTATDTDIDVPIYTRTRLQGLGAIVFMGYGTSLADLITRQTFGLVHNVP